MNSKCSSCNSQLNEKGLCPNCHYCSECNLKLNEDGLCPNCDYCPECGIELDSDGLCPICVCCQECGSILNEANLCPNCDCCQECGSELDFDGSCPNCDYCSECDGELNEDGLCPNCDYCPECDCELDFEGFCPNCGLQMKCQDCGSLLDSYGFCPDCDYCPNCGEFTDGSFCESCAYEEDDIYTLSKVVTLKNFKKNFIKICSFWDEELYLDFDSEIYMTITYDGEDYYAMIGQVDTVSNAFLNNEYIWNTRPIKTLQHICFYYLIHEDFIPSNVDSIDISGYQVEMKEIYINYLKSWKLVSIERGRIVPTSEGLKSFLNSINPYYSFEIADEHVELRPVPYIGNPNKYTYSIGTYYKLEKRKFKESYQNNLSEAIIQIKEYQNIDCLKEVSKLVSWYINEQMQEIKSDIVVPVPCYGTAFCHTLEIANLVTKQTGMDLQCPLIKMCDSSQDGLNKKERYENAQKTYGLKEYESVKDKTVLLLDDIYTTGATIKVCKELLNKAGAKRVNCLTIARTSK